jgi:tetratricopeptide (TPR) repeat protein
VLGLNYLQRKKYDDAQNYFKKALLRNNENINALMGITSLQIKNKESNKALSNIKLLELLDPSSSNSQLLLAQLHFSLEEYNLSQQQYQKIIRVEPDNVKAHIGMIKLYLYQGEVEKARKYHDKAKGISSKKLPFPSLMTNR